MSNDAVSSADIPWGGQMVDTHNFVAVSEGHYSLDVPEALARFDVDRLWRDKHDLCGELVVTCDLAGAKTFKGALFTGNVNLSSAYRRRDVCSQLRERSGTRGDVDWAGLLEELSARVVRAEREGQPPRLLSSFDRPRPDDMYDVHGLALPARHPSILFGDGGTFKSYLGLYAAGRLAERGTRVLYCDWELEGDDHRDRLERLMGSDMPAVYYHRARRPLVDEVDGLRRRVAELRTEYIICDSCGYATDGAPESAEAAMAYFRAVRQLGIGSLHLAHVTKPKDDAPDPSKPFGSVFWHNSARSTWYIKRTDGNDDGRIAVALFNKKANLGALRPPVGLAISFDADRTSIERIDVADVEEFARSLPIWQRMKRILSQGPRTLVSLADELGAADDESRKRLMDSMSREVRRKRHLFTMLTNTPDGMHRLALLERRSA